MTHGTPHAYNLGCRCEACRDAMSDYFRARYDRTHTRVRPFTRPEPVSLDVCKLRSLIAEDGRSLLALSQDCGWHKDTASAYLSRGRCNYFAADQLAIALGCFSADDITVTP